MEIFQISPRLEELILSSTCFNLCLRAHEKQLSRINEGLSLLFLREEKEGNLENASISYT